MPPFAASPVPYARLGGLAYLAIIVLGLFGEAYVRGTLLVPGNGLASALNIQQALPLWRAGIGADLLMQMLDVPLIVLFYLLLRPISPGLALMATVFNVVQTAVLAANKLTLLVPLLLVSSTAFSDPAAQPLVASLTALATTLHGYGFGVGLLFFGVTCVIRGYLMYHAPYFPRAIGVLLAVAGACYLLNSAALLLAPALAGLLFPWVLLPSLLGELALSLWLVARGVDGAAWARHSQAARKTKAD